MRFSQAARRCLASFVADFDNFDLGRSLSPVGCWPCIVHRIQGHGGRTGLEKTRELHWQPDQRSGLPQVRMRRVRLPAVSEAESDVSVAPGRLLVSQKGRRMLDAVKTLPEVVKNWKTNKDMMFQWVACVAALITVASWIRDQRPSEVIAEVLRLVGARSASDSFLSGLPPVLASPNPGAQHIVEVLVALLLIVMVSGPLYNAWRDDWAVDLQAQALLGARTPGTFWLLLMAAGQFGPLDWDFSSTRFIAGMVIIVVIIVMIVKGVIYLLLRRIGNDHLFARARSWINQALSWAGAILLMSVLGIALAAIAPVAGVISWLTSTESDAYRDMKIRIARERLERRKPDGAVQVPKTVSLPESSSAETSSRAV